MCSACNRASLFSLFLCAVCFHTQRFTHLYPSLLPCRFPAHISVCTQDYPTFYQAVVMFMNILSMLSRPLCLHTGESDYKYTCYKKKKPHPVCWYRFLSFVPPGCIVSTVWFQCFCASSSGYCSLDVQRNNLVSSSVTCHLQSVCVGLISLHRSCGKSTGFLHGQEVE